MSEDSDNEIRIEPGRILMKVQEDAMGKLLVENAIRQCVIEDQQEMIQKLRTALADKTEGEEGEKRSDGK